MYRHPRVMQPMERAQEVVTRTVRRLHGRSRLMPPDWTATCGDSGEPRTARAVCDYIAGMTDRFAARNMPESWAAIGGSRTVLGGLMRCYIFRHDSPDRTR